MGSRANVLPAVNMLVMKNCPTLTKQQQKELSAEITNQEIYDGMKAIGSYKKLGIDGYNVEFFKKAWPVIKEEVYAVGKDFFHTGVMYSIINFTIITLIPKIPNPVTIRFQAYCLLQYFIEAYLKSHCWKITEGNAPYHL